MVAAAAVSGSSPAAARPADAPSYAFCPPAKRLVTSHTPFRHHRLGPGIHFATAAIGPKHFRLRVNVVRVNLRNQRAKVGPLHRDLTHRSRLSRLAHRPHLVAATNASYFDFGYGAPTVPLVSHGEPLVMTRRHSGVVGLGFDGKVRQGEVWLVGRAVSPHSRHRLGALNAVRPPSGLSLYTSRWGRSRVPLPPGARTLPLRHDHALDHVGHRTRVPRHGGELLVATTGPAEYWLRAVHKGDRVTTPYHDVSTARHPFQQAYGVGTHVVAHHHLRTGLYCRRSEIYAARTDIAWAKHRDQLILATVDSPHGASGYGVDENQMSQVMVALGAAESYALDGGGSTELVAKLPHEATPSIRTHNHRERPIPVGIGVYSLPRSHHNHHHAPHQPKQPKGVGGLVGGLLGGLLHHNR